MVQASSIRPCQGPNVVQPWVEITNPNNGPSNCLTPCARTYRLSSCRSLYYFSKTLFRVVQAPAHVHRLARRHSDPVLLLHRSQRLVFLRGYKLTRTVSPTAPPASIVLVTRICTTVYIRFAIGSGGENEHHSAIFHHLPDCGQ